MSESRKEIVDVGVLGNEKSSEREVSEAMMRVRNWCDVKTAGKLACLLYPSSAHCRTFETRCPSRQEGKSVCNKLVDRCRKMNCAFSSFQLAPENPDVRNLVGTFIPRVTASDVRQQAGKHLRSTLFMYVAGVSSPTRKKPKGERRCTWATVLYSFNKGNFAA